MDTEMDPYADSYDLFFTDAEADVLFYVAEAQRAEPPVLELACGTGRVLIPVAQAGVEVVGLDLSPAMLAHARRKVAALPPEVRARITLQEADMRTFSLPHRFGLIYCPFRAFLALLTVEDQLAALERIRLHLKPGGRFALNFFDPNLRYLAESQTPAGNALHLELEIALPDGGRLLRWTVRQYEPARQWLDVVYIDEWFDAHGTMTRRQRIPLQLRWIYRYEFEYLLARAGFQVEALYGDFERHAWERPGQELIWIARATT